MEPELTAEMIPLDFGEGHEIYMSPETIPFMEITMLGEGPLPDPIIIRNIFDQA